VSLLPSGVKCHFGKRLTTFTQSPSSVDFQFEDGTSAVADMLIGSDGVKSAVRDCLYANGLKSKSKEDVRPRWTGTIAYRGLVPMELLKSKVGQVVDLAAKL
jgi:salicylate hydroxylase